jgi:hypothetical protein
MSSESREEYFLARTDPPNEQSDRHSQGYPEDEIEQPSPTLAHTNSSTDIDSGSPRLKRRDTTRSGKLTRQNTFEPINSGDREALHQIASQFSGHDELTRIATGTSNLERRDTLAGLELGDAVLDPRSPDFDLYKWVRMVSILNSAVSRYSN